MKKILIITLFLFGVFAFAIDYVDTQPAECTPTACRFVRIHRYILGNRDTHITLYQRIEDLGCEAL